MGNALSRTQLTSSQLAGATPVPVLRKRFTSEGPLIDQPSDPLNATVLDSLRAKADSWPLVKYARVRGDVARCEEPIHGMGLFLKRIMDVVVSSILLVFLWPLMLAIALAVKLESPGPVIYPSIRAGKWGRMFACYKFRTMIAEANELKGNLRRLNQRRGPFFKIAADPRVTRLGRFLRKYSLDELPQFWNVLKGDMTLVGPRPHPLDDVALYGPKDYRRLDVKPGLTGLWQVTARANPSFETCMALDMGYIRNWSLFLDFQILFRTAPAVLAGEGQ
jgi:lipopolysaccharide/colanic/teichoic acid biosynthesis glycosyltransferase